MEMKAFCYYIKMKASLPKILLHLEGGVVLAVSTYTYFHLHGSGWLFAILLLTPDICMLGYLAGRRIGSYSYNLFHTYFVPVLLGAVFLYFEHTSLGLIMLIWIAHIGMDRLLGFGLKYPTYFKDTHLNRS